MSLARRMSRSLPRFTAIRTYAKTNMPTPAPPSETHQPTPSTPKDHQQSPNVPTTWSTSQNPKPRVFDDPRFEQIDLSLQPNSVSAMGMVAEDPVRLVLGRRATCDGGGCSSIWTLWEDEGEG